MALIICESFDGIANFSELAGKWTTVPSFTITASGRNGQGATISSNNGSLRYALSASEQDDYLVIGFAFKISAFADRDLLSLWSNSGSHDHLIMKVNANAGFNLRRGTGDTTTVLDTINNAIAFNVWNYIELGVRISNSTSDLDIRVNGVSVLGGATGPWDTLKGAGSSTLDNVAFSSGNGQTITFDDIYILNEKTTDAFGNASNAVSFLGDCRVEALQPNGNGNSSQWDGSDGNSTDNYLLVDEVSPDDDTTYVQTGVDNEKDTYAFENLASTSGSVVGVQVVSRAKKTDLGTRLMAHVARSAGTELDSPDYALSTAYGTQRTVYENEPNTSVWTRAEVDAAEFGVKARS